MATYSASAFTLTVTERRVRYAAIVFSSATNNDSYRFKNSSAQPTTRKESKPRKLPTT